MTSEISPTRRLLVRGVLPLLLLAAHAVPAMLAYEAFLLMRDRSAPLGVLLAVTVYIVSFPLVSGLLSTPFRHAVVEGRFPRDLGHRVYGPRRLYAACWTALYYHPVVYHVVLALPWLKTVTFRLFGYRGSTRFTVYPDTWIRDLPLLEVGEGSYLSNNASVSPNMCLHDGSVVVQAVRIGAQSMIGHAARVGPGVRIGERSEVGVATALAIHVVVGDDVRIGHGCAIDRGVHVANRVRIAEATSLGANSSLAESARTPFGLTVPARVAIADTEQLLALAKSQGVNRSHRDLAVTPPPRSVSCGP